MSFVDGGIYCILNTQNGKRYIGSAVHLARRWLWHRGRLRSGKHYNQHLLAEWQIHGEPAFRFVILEIVKNRARLRDKEQRWADVLMPEYNAATVAATGVYRLPKAEEHRKKISDALTGKPKSAEHKQRMSEALAGKKRKPCSDETRAKLSAANAGKQPWITGRNQEHGHIARRMATKQRTIYLQKGKRWPDIYI